MNVTDKDMAEILKKTVKEVEELKKTNEAEYRVLRLGILCKKLNLSIDDLERLHAMKIATS